jgi:ketosteroid isomerase-like protein
VAWDYEEIVRAVVEAFNRRDLDAALRHLDPEIEVDWSRSRGVEAGVYHGYEATKAFWGMFLEMFERATVTPEEFILHGAHVVMPNRLDLLGRDGIEVSAHSVAVARFRDGRITVWRLYQDRAEALNAVGYEQ